MEYAIIGLTTFIIGTVFGLGLKLRFDSDREYAKGYSNGFNDASIAVEYLEKRMEGKS